MPRVEVRNGLAFSGPCDVFIVNDNAGRNFTFAPIGGQGKHHGTWISVDQIKGLIADDDVDRSREWTGAIGVVKRTDALLLGPVTPPTGLSLAPFDAAGRGAWYSYGFLMRSAAARLLDVGLSELEVGVSVRQLGVQDGNRDHAEIFLSDQLENGAGYSSWLGQPDNLAKLLDEADRLVEELSREDHACDSSCPDCLRDFTNLIFHPILDWRLGRDLVRLLGSGVLDLATWCETEELVARAFADAFDGTTLVLDGGVQGIDLGNRVLIVHHPLERTSGVDLTERLERAVVEAEERFPGVGTIAYASFFDLDRRPGAIAALNGI